ncbi:hypothetical protein UK23_35180 [Lentzea aerocolonigenes]|uniref:Histidine kinase/HSP90-like ATPase domain-containing protein n=2 Tax=Lentzea aerocolonigenes TaxID=68170 RepID=A0A0F0GHE3_LENAE|nr:hypothetical protein UK23_35180 [Lentzea aerocolonigenes]
MLGEAHRRRERGTEVVVGLVETHDQVEIRASQHGSFVELRIVDHGPALPKKAVGEIFARLSVAKGCTAAVGGEISAEDTPGGGLTIVISLPAYEETSP